MGLLYLVRHMGPLNYTYHLLFSGISPRMGRVYSTTKARDRVAYFVPLLFLTQYAACKIIL